MTNSMNAQTNKVTGIIYQGKNQTELLQAKKDEGYKSNYWVTYLQAKQMGKKLVNAKGKGVHLLRFSTAVEEQEEGKKYVNSFCVFNEDLLQDAELNENGTK